jgi:ribonuclease HI
MLRMAALPPSHPLEKHVKAATRNRKHNKSPLYHLFNAFEVKVSAMETISPVCHPQKWTSKLNIINHDNSQDTILSDIQAETEDDICIYWDSSGFEESIGGSAVMKRGSIMKKTLRFHLGSDKKHMVYEGEIVGMILVAEMIHNTPCTEKISLGVDSKVAIQAANSSIAGPGHYLMDLFHKTLTSTLEMVGANRIILRWTSGHTGIPGNEEADMQAKEAARGSTSNPSLLPKTLKYAKKSSPSLPANPWWQEHSQTPRGVHKRKSLTPPVSSTSNESRPIPLSSF